MVEQNRACIGPKELRVYLQEKLDECDERQIRGHLDECSTCQQALEDAAAEQSLWDGARELPLDQQNASTASAFASLTDMLTPTEDPQYLGRLGGYEVCGLIGRGSTGIVLKAFEPKLNRFVAIKVLSPALADNGAARQRFEREGRAIAAVSHENVVPIYAVDEIRGLPYIVMQYVPGVSLLQRIEKSGALGTCEVVRIGLQVARGLAAAHHQGIIHRDVKPANVILEDTVERARVTDFGLARVADEATMTRSGVISGTPQYMSPEQARGESVDPRTDLFSLGGLLYAACTARAPFRADTVFGIIHRVCESQPRAIRELNPEIAPWLENFIAKLMEKSPANRFLHAEEVAELLQAELAHLQNPTIIAEPERRWMQQPATQAITKPTTVAQSSTSSQSVLLWVAGTSLIAAVLVLAGMLLRGEWRNGQPPSGGNPVAGGVEPANRGNAMLALFGEGFGSIFPQEEPAVEWTVDEADGDSVTRRFRQRVEQSFSVESGGKIRVQAGNGDIQVRQTELDHVSLVVLRQVEAGSQAEAEKIVAYHDLSVQLNSARDSLEITAALDPEFAARGGARRLGDVVIGLGVPAGMSLELDNESGDISVDPLAGNLRATARGGNIQLDQITGDLWARATGGEIVATRGCNGTVDLMATHGNVCVAGMTSNARLRASNGNIYVGPCTGSVSAHATGGDVRIANPTGELGAHVAVGNVYLNLLERPSAEMSLSVTQGDIHVMVASDVGLDLETQGSLQSAVELTAVENAESEGWQSAELHGGGSPLKLAAPSGTIHLAASEPQASATATAAERRENSNPYFSLGGSGNENARKIASAQALEKTSGEPRPGAMVPIPVDNGGNIDGYTLYLPVSHGTNNDDERFPIILYLQGGYGVGGEVASLSDWGLPRLIRDETSLDSERNRLLLDTFIVVSVHIQDGNYDDEPEVVDSILNRVVEEFQGDERRIYVTGLSRGGHGSWGMCSKLPRRFAAAVPIGGRDRQGVDYSVFREIPVWIAHNRGDTTVDFSDSRSAADKVERQAGVEFQEFDQPLPDAEALDSSDYVFTHPPTNRHDAWTELYCSVEFYRWLLRHSR